MKIKTFFPLTVILVMFFWAPAASAKVTASVDRANIVVDETLTLTITSDTGSFFTDPDLKPLHSDFKVMGQSQQSSTRIINGKKMSSVSWRITLAPKSTGTLEIPPLSVGREKTGPISIQVSAEAPAKTRADNVPIFIETSVDEQTVYVQSQLMYTLRVYGAVNMQIIDPGEPDVEDALIEKLEDATFEKVMNGTTYRVFERKYALFPQKSGVLKIPQMVVQVQIPPRRRDFFNPFGSQGEIVKFRSESHEVEVREKPQEYPAAAVWLPASGFTVKEQWVQDPKNMKVGESTTLNLSIVAEGLMARQLPPVELVEPDGMKVYQGRAEVEDVTTATGVIGTRKESIALIPTQPGEVEIPEIRIPWWDMENRKVAYAVIPAKKIVVQGTAGPPEQTPRDDGRQSAAQAASEAQVVQQPVSQTRPAALIILSTVLAVAWLVTLFLFFQIRRRLHSLTRGQAGNAEQDHAVKEREALNVLTDACRAGNAVKARAAVLSWAKAFLPDGNIQTLSDITRILPDQEFRALLDEIDAVLYRPGNPSGQWQGDRLLTRVKKVRSGHRKKKKEKEELQELYR
jgi:hypothetical protein